MKNKQEKKLREKIETWLKNNSSLLNKTAFDRKAKMPEGTIQKFVKHNQRINDRRIKSIHRVIKKLGFENDDKKTKNDSVL
ncbi:hypothetical protein ACSTS3_10505 [Aquimarina muelleri]|uniref:hypothetical protein n=1 Tax=Aquimarina muelleri TaxID=279356 RepID=UPI003F6832D0